MFFTPEGRYYLKEWPLGRSQGVYSLNIAHMGLRYVNQPMIIEKMVYPKYDNIAQ